MSNQILLPNGCSMSTPSVTPVDWKTGGLALMKRNWQIQYYFYDPELPSNQKYVGKLIAVKGMNSYKNLLERRAVTKIILDDEIDKLKRGYHPIHKKYIIKEDLSHQELHPDLPFIVAFRIALEHLIITKKHTNEIRWAIDRIEKKAIKLKIADTTISSLKRSDLKRVLEACNLPDYYYNKVRGYVSTLFGELIEYECCDTNLTRDIRKRKIVSKERETLSLEHHKIVMNYLHSNYYEFWRYARIFLFSGSRTTELFMIKKEDVNIAKQEYKITIKKGKHHKEVTKVILKEVLPLWQELIKKAKPKEYLFSKLLKPGKESILSSQITKRWYRLVKCSNNIKDDNDKVLNITADFYSLKHSFLDSLPTETARLMASHTNSKTTVGYQVNKAKRDREVLKDLEVIIN